MAATQKVSISLDAKELRWVKAHAKRARVSVSSLLSEAVRTYREESARRAAQDEFLADLEPSERATPEEMEEIRAQWRG